MGGHYTSDTVLFLHHSRKQVLRKYRYFPQKEQPKVLSLICYCVPFALTGQRLQFSAHALISDHASDNANYDQCF